MLLQKLQIGKGSINVYKEYLGKKVFKLLLPREGQIRSLLYLQIILETQNIIFQNYNVSIYMFY